MCCIGGGSRSNNSGLGAIGTIAMVILAPVAAMLVQMAISRTREYAADEMGARISGRPDALASALARISNAAAGECPSPTHCVRPIVEDHAMDNVWNDNEARWNPSSALVMSQ